MTKLAEKECKPCKGDVPPLEGEELQKMKNQLGDSWKLLDEKEKKLEREFSFDNFKQALDFSVKVGQLAEKVDHHPNVCFEWGKATVTVWTHKIGGLSETDFIFAAKVNELVE